MHFCISLAATAMIPLESLVRDTVAHFVVYLHKPAHSLLQQSAFSLQTIFPVQSISPGIIYFGLHLPSQCVGDQLD